MLHNNQCFFEFKFFSIVCNTGGCAEEVDDKILHSAFIPFGEIVDIQMPLDYETGNVNFPNPL